MTEQPKEINPDSVIAPDPKIDYGYSLDGERFTCFEDVMETLIDNELIGTEVTIDRGEIVVKCHNDYLCAMWEIIEKMQENACEDYADDYNDPYLGELDDEKLIGLKNHILAWFNNNVEQPYWYCVENVKEITITVTEDY